MISESHRSLEKWVLLFASLPRGLRLRRLILQIWKRRYSSPRRQQSQNCLLWPQTHALSPEEAASPKFRIRAICDSSHPSLANPSISGIFLNSGWIWIPSWNHFCDSSHPSLSNSHVSFRTLLLTELGMFMKTEIKISIFFCRIWGFIDWCLALEIHRKMAWLWVRFQDSS